MINLEQLKSIKTKIINKAHILYNALANLPHCRATKAADQITIAQNYVGEVSIAAAGLRLKGLSAICQHTQQNIAALSTLTPTKCQTICEEIERWPKLILNYLHAPAEQKVHYQLIEYLQNTLWPHPCSDTLADKFRSHLSTDFVNQPNLKHLVLHSERNQKNQSKPDDLSPSSYYKLNLIELDNNIRAEKLNERNSGIKTSAPFPHHNQGLLNCAAGEAISSSEEELAGLDTSYTIQMPQTILSHKIIEESETLSVALSQLMTLETDNEALIESVEPYTDTVQSLWEMALELELKGIQDICTFINDNVFASSLVPQSERYQQLEPLSIWPKLLLDYLQSPSQNAKKLVEFVSLDSWPVKMEEALASNLLNLLMCNGRSPISINVQEEQQEIAPLVLQGENEVQNPPSMDEELPFAKSDDKEELPIEEVLPISSTELVPSLLPDGAEEFPLVQDNGSNREDKGEPSMNEELPEAKYDKLEEELPISVEVLPIPHSDLLIGQIKEVVEENTPFLNEMIAAEDGSEALLMATMTYTENVQSLSDAAEMLGLEALQEVCTFINDNAMELGSQPKSSRETTRDVLSSFPALMIAYLLTPEESYKALASHMLCTEWPVPLDSEAASQLEQRLIENARTVSTSFESGAEIVTPIAPDFDGQTELTNEGAMTEVAPIEEPLTNEALLVAPEILELVCLQISDSSEGLSAALEVCVTMENDNPAFLEAIEDYTNRVQEIWDAAEMAELNGLQEVCTFINDNLLAFSVQDQTTREAQQKYFLEWPNKVLEYLQSPGSGASHLVNFLQEIGWKTPLEEEAANQLLTLLKSPSVRSDERVSDTSSSMPNAQEFETTSSSVPELPPLDVDVGDEISLGSAEIVEILSSELENAEEDFAEEIKKFITLETKSAALAEATENYTEHVHRLYTASEMLGLEGIQTVCMFVIDNVKALSTESSETRQKTHHVLEQWPNLVLAYLKSPGKNSVFPLVTHFRQAAWIQPLTDDTAKALLTQLTAGSTAEESIEEAEAYARQTTAAPEDVFLTIPEDINNDLLDAYLQEVPQNAADFSTCIQNIIQSPEISEIERAQRIAHTLKGSSNIIGIKGIASIAHHLEDTLEYLAKHQIVAPPKELTDTMVEAADCLETMVDTLLGQDEAPPQAQRVLQSVLDWANRIDKGQLDAPPTPTTTDVKPVDAPQKSEPVSKKPAADSSVAPEQFLKVSTKTIDELMRLVGELSISVGQIQEKLKHVTHSMRSLNERDLSLQQKTFELENLVDVRGITGVENRYKQTAKSDEFDPLEFEEYNELHSVAHSFIEFLADNRELAMSIREDLSGLETMFIHQDRLNKEFQASIMTTRMVPVNTILSKLQRNIRQTCRATGKKVDLDVSGTDILIDSDVLSNLGDPLQHILRNSVDHGIEAPEERVILEKPENGHIQLKFYREGNNIVVSCQDDGQGLNYTNIRFTAIQRGLITENQEMTEQDLARLILMSGFSTKSGVTQVSGRGVGMDVVHTNIRQMKGTLDLMSETGKGTTILIKLPMTLVTVHVLLVGVGERTFGIQTNHLEQALASGLGDFHKISEEITLKMGKNFYAVKSLAKLLNMPDEKEIDLDENRPIILVHEETGTSAVLVDELLDTHDLVMKTMGKYVTHIRGVAGVSILGDGSLVPLLDLPELLRTGIQVAMPSAIASSQFPEEAAAAAEIPSIMIVDDSLSVRKSLSLLVEDAGFKTLLAKDGLEAIEVINQTRPNVMLVDMEMPRMNGLELTTHVRANEATQNMPIFMITSRTTEKHREQAKSAGVNAYLTKPYQDDELLDWIDKALAGQV
jgi:chemotaxis protein histidine kinase CheA/ActR/RegA family two-component response regulator